MFVCFIILQAEALTFEFVNKILSCEPHGLNETCLAVNFQRSSALACTLVFLRCIRNIFLNDRKRENARCGKRKIKIKMKIISFLDLGDTLFSLSRLRRVDTRTSCTEITNSSVENPKTLNCSAEIEVGSLKLDLCQRTVYEKPAFHLFSFFLNYSIDNRFLIFFRKGVSKF